MVKYGSPSDSPGREQGHDVGVLELGRQEDLPPEPLHADPGRQLGQEHLDHHPPLQRGLQGHEDPRHPPAAELPLDAVGVSQGVLELLPQIVGHGHQCSTPAQGDAARASFTFHALRNSP